MLYFFLVLDIYLVVLLVVLYYLLVFLFNFVNLLVYLVDFFGEMVYFWFFWRLNFFYLISYIRQKLWVNQIKVFRRWLFRCKNVFNLVLFFVFYLFYRQLQKILIFKLLTFIYLIYLPLNFHTFCHKFPGILEP